ncbi:hypothetical protein [uncultured Deinococcus sp.]|uniref:hypothetical protein n=1 Tax=uncultured Deinococcus sp. TaxID=158789 RepID=UPI002582FAE2|nr:hypothetical protein [uncultured Deinococcus sp.]
MTKARRQHLTSELAVLRAQITDLEAQTAPLTDQHDQAHNDLAQLRGDVRAGRTTLANLISTEATATTLAGLLSDHHQELTDKHQELLRLTQDLDTVNDTQRLDDLGKARTALFAQWEQQETAFMQSARDGLRALYRTHRQIVTQAQEMKTLRQRLRLTRPHMFDAVDTDADQGDSIYGMRDRLNARQVGSDGFRSWMGVGGPTLLLGEIEREEHPE